MTVITNLEKNGILEQMGVEAGDAIVEINGSKIKDVFDYRFLIADEYIEVLIRRKDGEEWLLEIDKEEGEDLGAQFAEPMMDEPTRCKNKCVFCFIDQLPKGMRETLYFKDDDSRLSFLQGNYVTLTNLNDDELERLIFYRFSPINVSVHTTDGALRAKMTGNRSASNIMERLFRISEAGIELNCQIVLVRGMNDGKQLEKSIRDLMEIDGIRSVSVVPAGITRYRDGLTPIMPLGEQDAREAIGLIHKEQKRALIRRGVRFVYAADELYLKCGEPVPLYEHYCGFPQLENGVGMLRLFETEFYERLTEVRGDAFSRRVSVVTGRLSADFMANLSKKLAEKFTKTEIKVIMVENSFFGDEITVSGLLTGGDVLSKLKEQNTKGRVLLPSNCFKSGTELFLDDVSLGVISGGLGIEAVKVQTTGHSFIDAVLR